MFKKKMLLFEIYLLWLLKFYQVLAKTQSNVIDDCPTCVGVTCPSEVIVYVAFPEKDTLTSPNYPENYPDNEFCRWMIVAPESWQVVRIEIHEIHIRGSIICKEDYLFIQDGGLLYSKQLRMCCQDRCQGIGYITSTGQEMRITFRSDGYRNDVGFNLTYWTVPKSSKEIKIPTYTVVNYTLFAVFAVTIFLILSTLLWITFSRRKHQKLADYQQPFSPIEPLFVKKLLNNKSKPQEKATVESIIEPSMLKINIEPNMLKRRTHIRKTRLDAAYFQEKSKNILPSQPKHLGETILGKLSQMK